MWTSWLYPVNQEKPYRYDGDKLQNASSNSNFEAKRIMDYSYLISSSEGIDIEYINNKQTIFVSQKNDMKCDKLCFITTVMEDLE